MKKVNLMLLTSLIVPMFFSCNKNVNKINTLFANNNPSKCRININYNDLNSMIDQKKTFVLAQITNSCQCSVDFVLNCLEPYINEKKIILYTAYYDDVKDNDKGIVFDSSAPTLHFFQKGNELKNLNLTYRNSNVYFKDYSRFKSYMDEHVATPSIFYINDKKELDTLYSKNEKYAIYYGISGCYECEYLRNNLLNDYAQSHMDMKKMYFLDFSSFSSEEFISIRYEYGLSELSNPTWGYGEKGALPVIHYVIPNSDKAKSINQAYMFGNDILNSEYKITSSYYNDTRLNQIKYGTIDNMIGKTFKKEETTTSGDYITLTNETNSKTYTKLFNSFMDYLQTNLN